jgi:hypothetical protein
MSDRLDLKGWSFGEENILLRRRVIFGLSIFLLLPACEAKSMRIHLNISLFNYLDRPIFDVFMNGTDFIGASANGFYGANGVMAMQPINLGTQVVSWRLDGPEGMARNGETVTAKNSPVLENLPKDIKWLGLHIYPDDTVEIKLSKGSPDELQTERGKGIIAAWEARHYGR